jgi:hypothetical protein
MQDNVFRMFIITIVAISYRHLLMDVDTARKQYNALKTHLNLGPHAQAFNAVKGLIQQKFINY